jgi:hypothetical protein
MSNLAVHAELRIPVPALSRGWPRTSGWIWDFNDLLEGMWVFAGTEIIPPDFAVLAERVVGISRSESDLNPARSCRDERNMILRSFFDCHCEVGDW